jgi:hypothetical protein
MIRCLTLLLCFVCVDANADWDDAQRVFDMDKNLSNTVTITIVPTSNVQATCEKESRRRGYNGFGYNVKACSFFDFTEKRCTVIVNQTVSMHSLGHEFLHCLQGNWH